MFCVASCCINCWGDSWLTWVWALTLQRSQRARAKLALKWIPKGSHPKKDIWPMISYDILWYPMISYDILLWYTTMISYDILWYPMISYDILLWYPMISYDILWNPMMPWSDELYELESKNKRWHQVTKCQRLCQNCFGDLDSNAVLAQGQAEKCTKTPNARFQPEPRKR